MFSNLFYLADAAFREHNFSDFSNGNGGEPFEGVTEGAIQSHIRESHLPSKRSPGRTQGFSPEFDPIFRVTLSAGSCDSFIRQHPELPITRRDYILSKAFQFLYLTIVLRYWPAVCEPTDPMEVRGAFGIASHLHEVLDRASDLDLPKLTHPDLTWWWDVYDDTKKYDRDEVLVRFAARMKRILRTAQSRKKEESGKVPVEGSTRHSIQGKEAVSHKTAAEYLSLSDRHIRRLIKDGQLVSVGKGQSKRITTDSLMLYKGAPDD